MEYAENVLELQAGQKRGIIEDLFSLLITQMSCSLVGEEQIIYLRKGSCAFQIFGQGQIREKYNCSCSFNENYREVFEKSELECTGMSEDGEVRLVEITQHPFFMAMLFQPQMSSGPSSPHPIIDAFLQASASKKKT